MAKLAHYKAEEEKLIVMELIESERISDYWVDIENYLCAAVSRDDGQSTIGSVYSDLKTGHSQLWIARVDNDIVCACVTDIVQYPASKRLLIKYCGGQLMTVWIDFIETIKGFAKAEGCDSVEVVGRKGWEKVLHKYGFDAIQSIFRCKIGEYEPILE